MWRLTKKLRTMATKALESAGYHRLPSGVAAGPGGLLGWTNLGSPSKQVQAMQGWVSTAVQRRATDLARLPIKLFAQKGASRDAWEQIHQHPLLKLWAQPNPMMTGYDLRYFLAAQRDLTGMCFCLIQENSLGRPAELWPLFVQNLEKIKVGDQGIKSFVFRTDAGQTQELSPEQVWYRRFPSMQSLFYGASIIQQQAHIYDIDLALRTYQRSFFQNSARPDVVLETDQPLYEADARRILASWNQDLGGPENAGKARITSRGLKAKVLQVSSVDLEFMALAGWTKDNILAAYGVPEGVLGHVEDVNRANMQGVTEVYRRDTIGPLAEQDSESITQELASRYDPRLVVEMENWVPVDEQAEHKRNVEELDRGVITINELRESRGQPPVAWGNVPLVQAQYIPLNQHTPAGDRGGAQQLALGRRAKGMATKDREWDMFARQVEAGALRMASALAGVFGRQESEVLRRLPKAWGRVEARFAGWSRKKVAAHLKDNGAPDLEMILEGWEKWDAHLHAEAWQRSIPAALADGAAEAIAAAGLDIVFSEGDPLVITWLQGNAGTAAKVNRYTRQRIKAHLVQAAENGETLAQVSERIKGVFDWCEDARAQTIAHTEVANARRFGAQRGLEQSGSPFKKEWRAEPGARDSHQTAARRYGPGKGIGLQESFSVGSCAGKMPGHTGCAEEDINCRCWAKYVPDTSGKAAVAAAIVVPAIRAYSEEECESWILSTRP